MIVTKLNYDVFQEIVSRDAKIAQLNMKQRETFDNIVNIVVIRSKSTHFFLHKFAKIDKIFLYKVLCYYYYAQELIVLYVILINIAT